MARDFTITPTQAPPPSDQGDANRSEISPSQAPEEVSQAAVNARRLQVVDAIGKAEGAENSRLVIEEDADSGRFVHKFVDRDTGEVLKQWPDQEFLARAKEISDVLGLWLDKRA